MSYDDLPSELRIVKKEDELLYWTKRGKVILVKDHDRANQLIKEGVLWRRVRSKELQEGIKAGSYNPVYDLGEATEELVIEDIPMEVGGEISGVLEVVEI